MSKAEHTAGPWSVYKFGETLSVCIGAEPDGLRPCIVDWPGFDSCNLPFEERLANAHLIAAAPKTAAQRDNLIAAVDQIKRAFGAPGDCGYGTPKGEALFALYRAAADAKGGAS